MVIGISGKIMSGKSEVLAVFRNNGFYSIDADKIVKLLYLPGGNGAIKVEEIFGKKVLRENGEVDREKLRKIVFFNKDKLKLLNNAIHPLVYDEIVDLIKNLKGKKVAIEAAYFNRGELLNLVDMLVWIERPKQKIIKALVNERGFSADMAERVYEFIEKPDFQDLNIIDNDGNIEDLKQEIKRFIKSISYSTM